MFCGFIHGSRSTRAKWIKWRGQTWHACRFVPRDSPESADMCLSAGQRIAISGLGSWEIALGWFCRGRIRVREPFVSLTRLYGLFACGFLGMAGCWLRLIRQVVEQQESLRIRFCSGLDERVRYSQFAQLLRPENQLRIGTAVVWIEHPQVNQSE